MRPSIHTWTRSPLASPGASSTIAAVSGKDEKRRRNQRSPALPRVLPSVETNRWGRWWRVVPEAWASLSITAVEVVPAATPAGVSRGATTRIPPRGRPLSVPGIATYTFCRLTGSPFARASRSWIRTRPAPPGTCASCPCTQRAAARSCAEPGGRSGAIAASCWDSSSVPWPSIVEGRLAPGPASGVCRVSRATTRATPATSQLVRYRRRFSTRVGPRWAGGGA